MNKIKLNIAAAIIIIPLLFTSINCSSTKEMISGKTEKDSITVDGDNQDWSGKLTYMDDEKIYLGTANDNDFLYLCISTNNFQRIMQIMRAGMIIWFKPEGGKTIGVQYPIAKNDEEQIPFRMGRDPEQIQEMEGRLIKAISEQNEFLLLNQDEYPLTSLYLDNKEGIKAAIGYKQKNFTYELKFPLNDKKNYQYNLSLKQDNNKIKLGLVTKEIERRRMGAGRAGMPGGGEGGEGEGRGRGGMGGMGRRNPGNMPGRGDFQPLDKLDLWISLKVM